MIAHAQELEATARSVLERVNDAIIFPLITLMSAVAIIVFLWGGFQFILNADQEGARTQGRQWMIWGIIGLFVMLSAYAILQVAAGTFGLRV